MLAPKLLAVLCVASARQAAGYLIGGASPTSGMPLRHRCVTSYSQRQLGGLPRHNIRESDLWGHRGGHREGFVLKRGGLYLGRLLLERRRVRPRAGSVSPALLGKQLCSSPVQSQLSQLSQLSQPSQGGGGLPPLAHGGALVALPMLGRLFAQASNLFQVGVLFGTVPTLLAGVVCCYWAWQVMHSIHSTRLRPQQQSVSTTSGCQRIAVLMEYK